MNTHMSIPDSVSDVGVNPFQFCNKLTSIMVSPNHPKLAVIDGVLFSKADKRLICYPCAFTDLAYSIPKGIRIIGEEAFYGCSSLASVTIPDSVTAIGNQAFYACRCLTSVTIPNSVSNVGVNPFLYCTNLTNIIVSPDHPKLAVIDGVLFSKTDKQLICYPSAYTDSAYSIPKGIRIIGDYAFYDCFSLTSVTIPGSVTEIGNQAFYDCWNLTSVKIPDSVTAIRDGAFSGCSSLTSMMIPNSVSDVGANPFLRCFKLTDLIVSPNHPKLGVIDGVLFSKADKRLICYPCAFTATEYSIPKEIRIIGDDAFYSCHNLTSVKIPGSVTAIGNTAFVGCDSLISVTIPGSVTTIGKAAFIACDECTMTVNRGSYAAKYCQEEGLKYTYSDSLDWLND